MLPHPASADYALAAAVVSIRREVALGFRPAAVRFARARPSDLEPYRTFFRAPLRFGAEENALELEDLARLRSSHADATLHGILERLAQHLVQTQAEQGALVRELRSVIAAELARGRPTAASLARRFGMSERTLRRRLAACGVQLSTLLDEVRFGLAQQYLGTMPVAEAAERLGAERLPPRVPTLVRDHPPRS